MQMRIAITYSNYLTIIYNDYYLVLRTPTISSTNACMQSSLDGIVDIGVHRVWNRLPCLLYFTDEMQAYQPWANHPCLGLSYGD